MPNEEKEAGNLIHMFAVAHGAVAFLLANTAIGDTVLLAGLTVLMVNRIGKVYGVEDTDAAKIIGHGFAHYAGAYVSGKMLFWLPGVGNWANAATTMLITETIGWACVKVYSSGRSVESLSDDEWESILKEAGARAKQRNEENKALLKKSTTAEKRRIREINDRLKDETLTEEQKEKLYGELEDILERVKSR